MNFPWSRKELNKTFLNAASPDLSGLTGEYLVNIVMVPGYRALRHRKYFYEEQGKVLGHNLLFNKTWGHFSVDEEAVPPGPLSTAVINYDRRENTFLIRRIRDRIRCVKRGELYIGRAGYRLFGKTIFLGYFTLEKTP